MKKPVQVGNDLVIEGAMANMDESVLVRCYKGTGEFKLFLADDGSFTITGSRGTVTVAYAEYKAHPVLCIIAPGKKNEIFSGSVSSCIDYVMETIGGIGRVPTEFAYGSEKELREAMKAEVQKLLALT